MKVKKLHWIDVEDDIEGIQADTPIGVYVVYKPTTPERRGLILRLNSATSSHYSWRREYESNEDPFEICQSNFDCLISSCITLDTSA